MEQGISVLILLYAVGVLLLLADVFLPSHGVLTIAALAVLGYALYLTFDISRQAGALASLGLAVVLPTVIFIAVKHWHRTPIGRRISPANPVLTESDRMPVVELQRLVGSIGRTLTPLRPVGTCWFDGRRVECMSEHGMIDANVEVRSIGLVDRTLSVRPVEPGSIA